MEFKVEIINVVVGASKCVLCLEFKDKLIAITDEKGLDIVAILCRHFWFSAESIQSQSVCRCCWNYVEEFHRFYQQVERLHSFDAGINTRQMPKDDNIPELETAQDTPNDEATKMEWPLKPDGCTAYVKKEPDPLHVSEENQECLEDRNDEILLLDHIELNEHKLRHNSLEKSELKCDQCNRSFKKKSQLNLHCMQHATEVACEADNLTCSACQKKFLNDKSLHGHYARVHGPEEIICEQCPERFKTLPQFKSHQKAKHNSIGDSRKQCLVCKRWLKNASSLRKHMYRHRSSDKQNVCNICGKNAPNALALKSHMLFVHRKERIYQCTICLKAFKRAFSLEEHMTIHTGKTLYNCAYCSKTFNSNANMHAHKKRVHPKEWEQSRREYEEKYECQTASG